MRRQVYFDAILPNVPRILSQINCNIGSRTYGCCERYHWHNCMTAIPNARFQEAVLTLALLYLNGPKEYQDNPSILRLINAMIGFWVKIQENDGSFNEWYVHEGSYVATAFSSYAVSETVLLLGKEQIDNIDQVLWALNRACAWLSHYHQKAVCNQQSGALIAIYNTYLLTSADALKVSAENYEQLIRSCQTTEGWFLEYGGPDIGYLSLTVDYLAKYYQKTGSQVIRGVLDSALGFLVNFIHRDGTSGGAYTSRETEFLIPHGVELLAVKDRKAAFIAGTIRKNLANGKGITPFSLDDRYLMYNGYTFLQAGIDGAENLSQPGDNRTAFSYYPLAGIAVWRRPHLELVVNLKKSGAFVMMAENQKICDSGILVLGNQRLYSGYLLNDVKVLKVDEFGFCVESPLCFLSENAMTPFKQIVLNAVQLMIGGFGWLKVLIKEILRRKLIIGHKRSGVILKRQVIVEDSGMRVIDQLDGLKTFERIIAGARSSFIYVPSSRLFQRENLAESSPAFVSKDRCENGRVSIERYLQSREQVAALKE